jgi:hypothetical protein
MLPSFTKGGPPLSLMSLQTPVKQHLLMQLASFTKGRPTSVVVFSLQLASQSGLGNGRGYCLFEAPLPREHLIPAGTRADCHGRRFQSRAAGAACAYGRRASKEPSNA